MKKKTFWKSIALHLFLFEKPQSG